MKGNLLGLKTLNYIWTHPNCKNNKIRSILNFLFWQSYKRITHKFWDIKICESIKLRCYPDSQSASSVIYCGLYDYNEMNFLLRYLREEDLFLDIGANVGVYTLLAASKIKSGFIYSFEALPKNYQRLEENLKLNKLTQVKPCSIAISNSTGNITINITESDSTAFITPDTIDKIADSLQNSVSATRSPTAIKVPTNTLDNILQDNSIANLTLAKMDIEGAEILAFKGATSLLEKKRPYVWIVEINDTVKNFGHCKQDVVDILHNYGYVLYQYDADTNKLYETTLEQQQGKNVLAIANSALDFVRDRLVEDKKISENQK